MANCKDCIHYGICTFHITGNENEKCPHYTPTADVAPKSEVEQLKRNLEQCENGYRQTIHLLQCKLKNAKSEVAREIFEEIEKFCRPPMPECQPIYVIRDSEMEELKSKYVEDM